MAPASVAITYTPKGDPCLRIASFFNITRDACIESSVTAILAAFVEAPAGVHPDRLVYALAGILFTARSPLPFGGSKRYPGYAAFSGPTPDLLLRFIVTGAFSDMDTTDFSTIVHTGVSNSLNSSFDATMWATVQARDYSSSQLAVAQATRVSSCLEYVVHAANHVVTQHRLIGTKDECDELVLRGMQRAGHIAWSRSDWLIPQHLRFGAALSDPRFVVEFNGSQDGL
ncbi:hypothetical protein HDU83_008450 [Entophlyctis luteolus]|nr:hypothetical protein HDU83_008450 [Entophlyctis luteolus]